MQEAHNALCSHNFVSDLDDEPELATNDEWCSMMIRARKDHGLSQEELAAKFGASQAIISKLEKGVIGASKLVRPISVLLSIPLPEHFLNEADREWIMLGRALRHRGVENAKRWYDLIKSTVEDRESKPDDALLPTKPEKH